MTVFWFRLFLDGQEIDLSRLCESVSSAPKKEVPTKVRKVVPSHLGTTWEVKDDVVLADNLQRQTGNQLDKTWGDVGQSLNPKYSANTVEMEVANLRNGMDTVTKQ